MLYPLGSTLVIKKVPCSAGAQGANGSPSKSSKSSPSKAVSTGRLSQQQQAQQDAANALPPASLSSPGEQHFLTGHTNLITCIAVSKSGRYIASGQVTHMGYQVTLTFLT